MNRCAVEARIQEARASARTAAARGESTTFWDERVDAALDELIAMRPAAVSGSTS